MKLLVVLAPVVFLSCGVTMKRAGLPARAVPVATELIARAAENEEEENEDAYREAAEFYLLKRVAPGEDLPVERYLAARQHARQMPLYSLAQRRFVDATQKSTARDADLGSWQPLGPGNVGGRTRSFVINPNDPNTMYAGSVGGGVWKTTDGGATWNPLTDLLPSIGIGALAIDPQDPNTLYAGTGEYYTNSQRGDSIRGLGIFKTTDAGATWTQLATTANTSFYFVNKIVVSPNDSRHVYAATYGAVWSSLDGGATWTRSLDRSAPNFGCQDLAIRTDQATDYLFASCGLVASPPTVIFRNVDAAGGGKWESVHSQNFMGRTSLALAPSNQSTIYAISSSVTNDANLYGLLAVYRSDSNGDPGAWNTQVSNQDPNRLNTALFTNPQGAFSDICSNGRASYLNQGDYDNAISVDPQNPDVVWVGGVDVFRSDDGGKNWGIAAFWQAQPPQLAHADVHGIVFPPGYNGADNQTLFAISDGGIYRTDNSKAAVATGDRAACSPFPTKIQWANVNNGYAVTQFYHGAVFPGGGAYWGGTQDNGTVRGSDGSGAQSWQEVIGGDGGDVAIDPTDPNIIFGETTALSLRRSTNGGASFSTITTGIGELPTDFLFITPFVMDPTLSTRLYIGGRALWRTTNSGTLWASASNILPASSGSISAIAVSPSDPTKVVFGTSAGFVYSTPNALTSDKTTDWSASQPRPGYLSHVAFDPGDPNIVYATYSQFLSNSAQSHVYKSVDGGVNWTGKDKGAGAGTSLPDIPVFTVIVDPQNSSTLYLGTDIGLFVSLDGGDTWARDDNPFADAVTETLVLDRSSGQSLLFAFTHGRGVWKVALPGSGASCEYTAAADSTSIPAFGATATVKITAGANCAWSGIAQPGIATVQSPAGGSGSGSFKVTVAQNTTTQPRVATVLVQDKAVILKQDPALAASGNDEAASAFEMTFPAVAIEDTTSATESTNDPIHSCTKSKDSKTLWFKVQPTVAGTVTVRFTDRRLDTGTNAGAVMALYTTVPGGSPGAEFGCAVIPQSASILTSSGLTFSTSPGPTYLIEISATTSGAPDGAQILGGALTVTAALN